MGDDGMMGSWVLGTCMSAWLYTDAQLHAWLQDVLHDCLQLLHAFPNECVLAH